jgi:hypothetical protein
MSFIRVGLVVLSLYSPWASAQSQTLLSANYNSSALEFRQPNGQEFGRMRQDLPGFPFGWTLLSGEEEIAHYSRLIPFEVVKGVSAVPASYRMTVRDEDQRILGTVEFLALAFRQWSVLSGTLTFEVRVLDEQGQEQLSTGRQCWAFDALSDQGNMPDLFLGHLQLLSRETQPYGLTRVEIGHGRTTGPISRTGLYPHVRWNGQGVLPDLRVLAAIPRVMVRVVDRWMESLAWDFRQQSEAERHL